MPLEGYDSPGPAAYDIQSKSLLVKESHSINHQQQQQKRMDPYQNLSKAFGKH
jgi:hypothetical protein